MVEKTKRIFALVFVMSLTLIFLASSISAEGEGQTTLYCAEKTTSGAKCQNVPLDEVNTNFRYDRTSCDSTSYCSTGTCVNTRTGDCLPSPQATCDSSQGGFFYNQPKAEVPQCNIGCCILGDEAKFVERVACDALGSDYNVQASFRDDIRDEPSCLALASPEEKGACVFETSIGRDCKPETREECGSSGGEFHPGFLCTAPQLGTRCAMTTNTRCEVGQNNVYFVDSCGNSANVYDASKVKDVAYWSYVPGVEGVEVSIGNGNGNKGSATNGNCEAGFGSTCRSYERGIDPNAPQYGDNICRDTSCSPSSLTLNVKRNDGDEWCSAPQASFENATPGDISYAMYCNNGQVEYELCDAYRNKICSEDGNGGARCVANRWSECTQQNNTKGCLDSDYRDCKIVAGAGILRTQYSVEEKMVNSDTKEEFTAACVPKYSPGFKFWGSSGTLAETDGPSAISICNYAGVECYVPYTQEAHIPGTEIGTPFRAGATAECVSLCQATEKGWGESKCYQECTPTCFKKSFDDKNSEVGINSVWAEGYETLCVSLGDCGVSANYQGGEGYNSWKDLFTGEKIDWRTLPNADDKK